MCNRISHKYGAVFLHIPKTGGTTIERALDEIGTFETLSDPGPLDITREMNREYLDRLNGYFFFTFSRNPFDRAVSAYKYSRDCGQFSGAFHDFLMIPYSEAPGSNEFIRYHYVFPQISWTNQKVWPIPHDQGDHIYDFCGRTEHLQDGFELVCSTIGCKAPKLGIERESRDRTNYTEFYSDHSAQYVAERFRLDFQEFGYKDKI